MLLAAVGKGDGVGSPHVAAVGVLVLTEVGSRVGVVHGVVEIVGDGALKAVAAIMVKLFRLLRNLSLLHIFYYICFYCYRHFEQYFVNI